MFKNTLIVFKFFSFFCWFIVHSKNILEQNICFGLGKEKSKIYLLYLSQSNQNLNSVFQGTKNSQEMKQKHIYPLLLSFFFIVYIDTELMSLEA